MEAGLEAIEVTHAKETWCRGPWAVVIELDVEGRGRISEK